MHIASAMSDNYKLKNLDLAWNHFGKDGTEAIAEALLNNESLETLDLSNNSVDGKASIMLASSLRRNHSVKFLKFNGNSPGLQGMQSLFRSQLYRIPRELGDMTEEEVPFPPSSLTYDVPHPSLPRRPPLKLDIFGCNLNTGETQLFDAHLSKSKTYILDMSRFYDRAVFDEILTLYRVRPGFTIQELKIENQLVNLKLKSLDGKL